MSSAVGLVRDLTLKDIDRIVAIDAAGVGTQRRRFFERRLDPTRRRSDEDVTIGLEDHGVLVGFAFARLINGEIGPEPRVAVLEAVGVDPRRRDRGLGHVIIEALLAQLRKRDIRILRTHSEWSNHATLRFFESTGFALAARQLIERRVDAKALEPREPPASSA